MTAPLRPMNLGEILDRTLLIYRGRFLAFVAVGSVPALIVQGIRTADIFWLHLYSSATRGNSWPPGLFMMGMLFSLGYYHFASFFGLLLFPITVRLASCTIFNEEVRIREALGFAGSRWPTYLWLSILKIAAELIVPEIIALAVLICEIELTEALRIDTGIGLESLWMIVLPLISGFAVFFWVGPSLSLAVPAAAFEDLKGIRALRRSWRLTRESRLRIAIAWVALMIAWWMLSASFLWLLRLAVLSVLRATHLRWISYTLYPILNQTLITVLSTLLGHIFPIAITLFYYDQRIRREGYDIERMMDTAGMNAPGPSLGGESTVVPAAEEVQP